MEGKSLVRRYPMEYEAKIDFIKLREAEIDCWIMNKKDSVYVPLGDIELYVNPEDLDKALSIVN